MARLSCGDWPRYTWEQRMYFLVIKKRFVIYACRLYHISFLDHGTDAERCDLHGPTHMNFSVLLQCHEMISNGVDENTMRNGAMLPQAARWMNLFLLLTCLRYVVIRQNPHRANFNCSVLGHPVELFLCSSYSRSWNDTSKQISRRHIPLCITTWYPDFDSIYTSLQPTHHQSSSP